MKKNFIFQTSINRTEIFSFFFCPKKFYTEFILVKKIEHFQKSDVKKKKKKRIINSIN